MTLDDRNIERLREGIREAERELAAMPSFRRGSNYERARRGELDRMRRTLIRQEVLIEA